MKTRTILAIIAIILVASSCKSRTAILKNTSEKETSKELWRSDPLFNPAWYDSLQSHKQEIDNDWRKIDAIKNYSSRPYMGDYNLFMSKEDYNGSEIIPIEVYDLPDSNLEIKLSNGTLDLNKSLTLRKDLAEFFVVKNKKIYYKLKGRLENNTWDVSGYGPIFKTFSDSLAVPLILDKKKVFIVYTPSAFSGTEYFVFQENKKLISLGYGGVRINFIDHLKKNLNIR